MRVEVCNNNCQAKKKECSSDAVYSKIVKVFLQGASLRHRKGNDDGAMPLKESIQLVISIDRDGTKAPAKPDVMLNSDGYVWRLPSYLFTVITFLVVSLFFIGCKNETRNIQSYYLPLDEIKDGLVYEYQAVNNDSLAPFYWYFRLLEKEDRTILTSTYYDHTFTTQQLSNEEIVSTGVILDDLFLYATDTLTGKQQQNPVRVEWDNAFPFEVTDSTNAYLYKIYWTDIENPNQKIRLIRNRHFMGDATYTYKEKQIDCVRFLVKELLEVEEEGFQELQFQGVELYAKGLGLVYYKKSFDGQVVQEYELANRFPMEELERRYYENR